MIPSLSNLYNRLNTTPVAIAEFCQKWHLTQFAVFGSVVRDDFRPDSDIDVLITYAPGVDHSLLKRVRMKYELEDLFHREVDLLLKIEIIDSHNWIRRQAILESEQVIYEQR